MGTPGVVADPNKTGEPNKNLSDMIKTPDWHFGKETLKYL
jgi:hypothetical protein